MKVVHLLRKPCSEGTVAANVLRWGTGALNIDASRVAFTSEADEQESKTKNQHANFDSAPITGNVAYGDYSMLLPRNYNPPGRWPANLVLQHLDGCRCEGTKEVKPPNGSGRAGAGSLGFQTLYVGGVAKGAGFAGGSVKTDGTETVAAWTCEPGCPVTALDAQSGVSKSTGGRTVTRSGGGNVGSGKTSEKSWSKDDPGFGDVGGASRFFKQVKA